MERARAEGCGGRKRDGEREERACRRTRERKSTEACLPRRTRCKGARTRRCHAFSTKRRGLQPHDVDVDSHDGDDDDDEEVDVITGPPRLTTVHQESPVFLPLQRLAGTPSPPRHVVLHLPLPLRAPPPLTPLHGGYYVNGRVASNPTIQNPASGVNVPKFLRAPLLNMHLLRFGRHGGRGRGGLRRGRHDSSGWLWRGGGRTATGGATGFFLSFGDARDWNAGSPYSASRNASILDAR